MRSDAAEARPHVLYLVTSALTARVLLRGQLAHLRGAGYRVSLVCAPGPGLDQVAEREGVDVYPLPMQREIAPFSDLVSLFRLWRRIRSLEPDLVNAGTPKAALLGMVTSRLAGVRRRVYLLRGLRLETTTGARRRLLGLVERVTAGCSTRVLAVSPSLAARYLELGLAPAEKVSVLGGGSSNGVDIDRFERTRWLARAGELRRFLDDQFTTRDGGPGEAPGAQPGSGQPLRPPAAFGEKSTVRGVTPNGARFL